MMKNMNQLKNYNQILQSYRLLQPSVKGSTGGATIFHATVDLFLTSPPAALRLLLCVWSSSTPTAQYGTLCTSRWKVL